MHICLMFRFCCLTGHLQANIISILKSAHIANCCNDCTKTQGLLCHEQASAPMMFMQGCRPHYVTKGSAKQSLAAVSMYCARRCIGSNCRLLQQEVLLLQGVMWFLPKGHIPKGHIQKSLLARPCQILMSTPCLDQWEEAQQSCCRSVQHNSISPTSCMFCHRSLPR